MISPITKMINFIDVNQTPIAINIDMIVSVSPVVDRHVELENGQKVTVIPGSCCWVMVVGNIAYAIEQTYDEILERIAKQEVRTWRRNRKF